MAQFSAAAAYNITYAPYVSDYSRYLPKETTNRSIIASVFFGAAGSAIWLIAIGAWLATSLGATDGLVGLMTAGNNVIDGLGDLAAFFSAAALAATMGMNAYGGALTVLTAIDSVKPIKPTRRARVITILALAVVWFAIGKSISASAVTTVFTSLTLMLYLLVPWTAANLVDFFFVRRGHYAITELFKVDGIYGRWGQARPDRLRARLRVPDPVHGAPGPRRLVVHRVHGEAARRRRHRLDRRPDRRRRLVLAADALARRGE